MVDILDEIKEDLQRERFQQLFQRYGLLLIGLVVAIILGTAAGVWWKQHQLTQQQKAGDAFQRAIEAINAGDTEAAISRLKRIINNNQEPYAALAQLRKAEALVTLGKPADALAVYDALAADKDADQHFRALAELLGAYQAFELPGDTAIDARLEKLAAKDHPFRLSGLELRALRALQKNDKKTAVSLLRQITADAGSPPALRARADEILSSLEPASKAPLAKLLEEI